LLEISLISFISLGSQLDRTDYAPITRTATEIAIEFAPDGFFVIGDTANQHISYRHQHTRRAETALQAMAFVERLLDYLHNRIVIKTLNRLDRQPFADSG